MSSTDTLQQPPAPSNPSWFTGLFASLTLLALVVTISTASAAGSSKSPPTPKNFRVTAKTAYTVTVAWDAAPANSGTFNYHLSGAYHVTPVILPHTATSHTFTSLHAGNEYWFFIYAKNSAGKVSGQANTTTRTLLDTTAPSGPPVLTVGQVGSTYANLSWTNAPDDSPHQRFEIWVDGSLRIRTEKNIRSYILRFLQPDTTYAISVRAFDEGNNASPFSPATSVRTPPENPNDTTAPTVPTNLGSNGTGDGSTEVHISWGQSTDNVDAQSNIRYDVYVNGALEDIVFGTGGPIIVYVQWGENTIEVTATDTAGNTSAPATTTITL